ncbi:XdhC/CoxI family protein [bacterium]|nr:XdhC/CoxI family protein [bacterium]
MMTIYEFYAKVLEAIETEKTAYLATIAAATGSTPQKPGAKMLIYADGKSIGTVGGGDVERKLIEDVITRQPQETWTVKYVLNETEGDEQDPKMSCGGSVSLLVEPLANPHQLYIVGGGHCGVELSKLAAQVGFAVTVYDNREAWANKEKHPFASRIICAPYDEVTKHIKFSDSVYIVIMTHGHNHDEEILRLCIREKYKYLGAIGSRRKSALMFEHMKADGYAQEELSRVKCPIGLPIPSHTPAEIAVSIVAQLIEVKNKE